MPVQETEPTSEKHAAANPYYMAFHQPRFDLVLSLVRRHRATGSSAVLDIGLSPLTTMLSRALCTRVDSLGLEPDAELPTGCHFQFDLNDAQYRDRWRLEIGPYRVIVFAEVLEHLYTAPELVLVYLGQLLSVGGLLILQTPNAASFTKRIKLLFGRNPFEKIRVDRSNPGHFREYTLSELVSLLEGAGFSILEAHRRYYFDARFMRHERGDESPRWITGWMRNELYRRLPPALREGITILARKDGPAGIKSESLGRETSIQGAGI